MTPGQDDALDHQEGEQEQGSPDSRRSGDPPDGAAADDDPRSQGSPKGRDAELARLRDEADRERARANELREQLMRTAADFDNFRKRTERDRIEERKQAAAGLVRNLLPVLDAVGRALQSAQQGHEKTDLQGFIDGVHMIEAQLFEVLKAAGLERVDTTGGFDPVVHEALMQQPSEEHPHLAIIDVFEPGYRLGGKLLRPARVKVAHNPDAAASEPGDEREGGDDADEAAEGDE